MAQTRRQFLVQGTIAAGIASVHGWPRSVHAQGQKLVVWWNKGYYPEEDAAMQKIAKEFESRRKVEVDLSFTAQEDLLKKINAALIARRVPDVAFCFFNDWQVVPKYGWTGQLADLSDVVGALKSRYNERMLAVANVMNGKTRKRAYYGVPIEAQTMHIHYWRDLLREVGMPDDPASIPMKWDEYWTFWKKAQDALRKKDAQKYGKLYGIGMTESTRASDTLYNFDMALLSFNGEVVDRDGKVVADQPNNKKAITETLRWFGELFTSGYVPPDATNWTDGDNNAGFHSRLVVMTPNPSQSIPAAQFFNKDDPEKKNYFDNMATIEWPNGPDGKKARYLSAVKTIVVPAESKQQKTAKDFISFVVEKDRFLEYIKAANGRWFPAFADAASDPFWRAGHKGPKGQKDPHIPVATTIFLDRENRVFDHYKHPAFSQVYDENVWGKAMARVAIEKWAADKAADEGIQRVKAIFTNYK
jgi:multiple sugar transport system substrate-binding protein